MSARAIVNPWVRVPNKIKVDVVTCLLIPFAFLGGLFLALNFKTVTLHETVPVVRAPASGAKLAAAWGHPDSVVAGASINAGLKGTTCAVYQSRRAVVCYVAAP